MRKLAYVAGGTLFVLITLTVLSIRSWPPKHSAEVASWVQAMVTAAALVVALFMPFVQHQMDAERARREAARLRADRHEAVYQLAFAVQSVCDKVLDQLAVWEGLPSPPEHLWLRNAAGELEAIKHALQQFSPAEFSGHRELMPAIGTMAAATALANHMNEFARRASRDNVAGELSSVVEGVRGDIAAKVDLLRKVADAANKEAGVSRAPDQTVR